MSCNLLRGISYDAQKFGTLYDTGSTEFPPHEMWAVHQIFTPKLNLPHIACTLANGEEADDRILRSELICLLRLMQRRMRAKALLCHEIIPVCLYSPPLQEYHANLEKRSVYILSRVATSESYKLTLMGHN